MRVVVIGANGQVGTELCRVFADADLVPLTHADLEVRDRDQVVKSLARLRPDLILNTAAFHKVDVCEEEVGTSFAVNASGAQHVALAAAEAGAALVYFSTDYVFDGNARHPYREADPPSPRSVYGVSKLAGEFLVRAACPRHYIVRTSGLYGHAGASGKGGNFVELMLRLACEGKPVRVVTDQVLTPTAVTDLALSVRALVTTGRYGLYHVTNAESCSWFEFARAIFELSGLVPELQPTTTAAFGARAPRPAYSVLAHEALRAAGLPDLRPWREALAGYLRERDARQGTGDRSPQSAQRTQSQGRDR